MEWYENPDNFPAFIYEPTEDSVYYVELANGTALYAEAYDNSFWDAEKVHFIAPANDVKVLLKQHYPEQFI